MRTLLLISFFVILNYKSHACLSAHQNRVFPLGMIDQKILVFETHLHRGEFGNAEFEAWWRGITYLNTYNQKNQLLESKIIDTLKFKHTDYEASIQPSFLKILQQVKKLKGFIEAKPVSIYFYDYSDKNKNFEIIYDTVKISATLKLENKNYPINVLNDTNSIAREFLEYYTQFESKYIPVVYINSIRKFKAGDKTFCIVHMGNGHTFENADGTYDVPKPYAARFSFNKIETSVFDEPVLHHGHGFDFVILE